jgi:guanosine-3',5'-bis(diphosphate) 3'-pyrophosphohydrolase
MDSAAPVPFSGGGVSRPLHPASCPRFRATEGAGRGLSPPGRPGRIEAAYHFAADAHTGQLRKSGEPYISHPVAVAEILAGWHLDAQALCAALLHDVMEDTHITKAEIAERFGTTAELVDGVSKLDKIEFQSHEEAQAENFRKMLMAMASDLRVILIKLADRLHNMRTLDHMRPDKRRRIARETQEIHAPSPTGWASTASTASSRARLQAPPPDALPGAVQGHLSARGNRREVVGKILAAIEERLPQWHIEAEVRGRRSTSTASTARWPRSASASPRC